MLADLFQLSKIKNCEFLNYSVEIFDEAGNNVFKAYTNSKKGYNTCRFIDGRMLTKNEYTVRLANTSAAYVKKIKREFVPA